MSKKILTEISDIKKILSVLIGSSHIPEPQKFSKVTLDKAAKLFIKLKLVQDQWINSYDLNKYFKGCYRYEVGKFLREEFGFINYYSKGKAFFYNKQDIINLAQELKPRDVDLATFMELRRGQQQLEEKLNNLAVKNRDARVKGKQKKSYKIPDDLMNIKLSDYKLPDVSVVELDIKNLMDEFKKGGYKNYIDIYHDSAFIKYDDNIREYLTGAKGARYRSWCRRFGKARYALKIIKEHQI